MRAIRTLLAAVFTLAAILRSLRASDPCPGWGCVLGAELAIMQRVSAAGRVAAASPLLNSSTYSCPSSPLEGWNMISLMITSAARSWRASSISRLWARETRAVAFFSWFWVRQKRRSEWRRSIEVPRGVSDNETIPRSQGIGGGCYKDVMQVTKWNPPNSGADSRRRQSHVNSDARWKIRTAVRPPCLSGNAGPTDLQRLLRELEKRPSPNQNTPSARTALPSRTKNSTYGV